MNTSSKATRDATLLDAMMRETDRALICVERRRGVLRVERANLGASALFARPVASMTNIPFATICEGVADGLVAHIEQALRAGYAMPFDVEADVSGGRRAFRARLTVFGTRALLALEDVTETSGLASALARQEVEFRYAREMMEAQAGELVVAANEAEAARLALADEVERRVALEAELLRQSRTDPLTGLANRRGFQEAAERALAAARRYRDPVSVVLVDADRFKSINDTHGHDGGDAALAHLARLVQEGVRADLDVVGRLGGEEFAILLPRTDAAGAGVLAERLRATLAASVVVHGEANFAMTASFGVATVLADETLESATKRADDALYRAKAEGRNRVVAASERVRVAA